MSDAKMSGHPSPKIPAWMGAAARDLVQTAEGLFEGPGRGAERKEWVRKALKDLALKHDIKAIPDWLETPLEQAFIDVVIEVVYQLIPKFTSAQVGQFMGASGGIIR